MKKIFTLLALALCVAFTSQAADDATAAERNMRSQIINYMHQEGYASAKVDTDGDIAFKIEGKSHYIEISEYADGMYVTLYYLIGAEGENTYKVLKGCDAANYSYKFVKVYRINDGKAVKFATPMYITSMSVFRQLFPNMVDIIQSSRKVFLEQFD